MESTQDLQGLLRVMKSSRTPWSAEDGQDLLGGNSAPEEPGICGELDGKKLDGMGSLAHSGTTRIGSVNVGEVILTACHPKKHRGTTLGQSHPSRQRLPVAGSRMSLSSCQGAFQTSHFHLPQ